MLIAAQKRPKKQGKREGRTSDRQNGQAEWKEGAAASDRGIEPGRGSQKDAEEPFSVFVRC